MSTWGHSIVPAERGHRCVRNRCEEAAVWQARYRSRSALTSRPTYSQDYLCARHGASWAARHGLILPEPQETPAGSPAGARHQSRSSDVRYV